MTLGDAHHGDLLRLLSDPAPCHSGCCGSRGVTRDGRVLPVHAAVAREVLRIAPGPGGAR
jgi:hypothetical protein